MTRRHGISLRGAVCALENIKTMLHSEITSQRDSECNAVCLQVVHHTVLPAGPDTLPNGHAEV